MNTKAAMAQQESTNRTCPACGARLAPDLRYCLACYRPVANKSGNQVHVEAVRAVDTTRRVDPTIIFLPDEHEAIQRRVRNRKRAIVTSAIILTVIAAGLLAFKAIIRQRRANERATAREQMALRELDRLADGLERFKVDMGRYPTDLEGLGALTHRIIASKSNGSEQLNYWMGPYVDGVYEVDPWGNDYVYRLTNGGESFDLFSYGPDGDNGSASRLEPGVQHSSSF